MNPRLFLGWIVLLVAGCAPSADPRPTPPTAGCSHHNELAPLQLQAADRAILDARSRVPKTAADYYFALPASYFSIVENSPERRATFIAKDTLNDSYLHARHWFECDGGGFELTLRLFKTADGPLIAIQSSTYPAHTLYADENPTPGELKSITVERPQFWRYSAGNWVAVDDSILPMIQRDQVIDRYRNHHRAHLQNRDQQKFIWLRYELPRTGNTIRVTGRENFMEPSVNDTWATYPFDGQRFRAK